MNSVIFRVDANPSIGMGHLMRCLSIADAFIKIDYNSVFVVADDSIASLVHERGYETYSLQSDYSKMEEEIDCWPLIHSDYIIVDSYYVNTKYLQELNKFGKKIVYIDDGSKDETWNIIKEIQNNFVVGLKLAHNRGHQNALLAGLMYAKEHADAIISMDADLQDDINIIDEMIKNFSVGYEIVYGVRSERKKDTFFKRNTAQMFYKFMKLKRKKRRNFVRNLDFSKEITNIRCRKCFKLMIFTNNSDFNKISS